MFRLVFSVNIKTICPFFAENIIMQVLTLTPGQLTYAQIKAVHLGHQPIALDPSSHTKIHAAQQAVDHVIQKDKTVYGINTGFGLLANTRIAEADLELLQRSIVLSHSAGIGDFMQPSTVRLMMLLKINSLARGYSGVRLALIEALISLYNAEVYPAVPEKGSVGASGDLAPLAHMSAVLLGEGEVLMDGKRCAATQGLEKAGLSPFALAP